MFRAVCSCSRLQPLCRFPWLCRHSYEVPLSIYTREPCEQRGDRIKGGGWGLEKNRKCSRIEGQEEPVVLIMPREQSDVRRSDSIIPCFICIELVIMVGTVLLTYYLEFTDIFSVHRQGFFCFDSTNTKPYPGPEETSLLPPVLLQSLASAVPMTTIVFGELAAFVFQAELVREERTIVTADCCSLNPLLRRVIRFLGVYAFGLCATDIFVNAGQVVTGSPAPHFMTVCQPNYTALGCQLSTQFISSENACTGSPGIVSSARRAFPCKDSALTMYAAVYTVMYVTIMFQAKGTRLTKPMLCLTLLCLTFLTGVVRVSEFRNHWSDVLVGFLTGGAVAVFLVCCVLHNFKSLNSSQENPRNVQEPVCVKLALPCVESPLEKIAQLHSQKVRDRTSGIFPSTPDVLIATQSVMSEV